MSKKINDMNTEELRETISKLENRIDTLPKYHPRQHFKIELRMLQNALKLRTKTEK